MSRSLQSYYKHREKRLARQKEYRATPEGQAAMKRSRVKYSKTEKGKITAKKVYASAKRKARCKLYDSNRYYRRKLKMEWVRVAPRSFELRREGSGECVATLYWRSDGASGEWEFEGRCGEFRGKIIADRSYNGTDGVAVKLWAITHGLSALKGNTGEG